MISEAVSARLPVVGVAPRAHRFTDEERSYRNFLIGNGWCRVLPIAELTPDAFARALSEIEPHQAEPARCACRQAQAAPAAVVLVDSATVMAGLSRHLGVDQLRSRMPGDEAGMTRLR